MKKSSLVNCFLVLIFLVGLSLLLYPAISDYWNSFHQSRIISEYTSEVAVLDDEQYEEIWKQAEAYNLTLLEQSDRFNLTEEEQKEYESLLSVSENGIIGYIEIPKINCSLPIYHGTDDAVLQVAIGHIPGSSLPTGQEGTHTVLSGHRGLPSAKLFTDLDQLNEGDCFILKILDETLTYEVDQILIVEPYELDALEIEKGKDYCTLVTCTPYGINSHRLLVRGHRVENAQEVKTVRVTADAIQIEPIIVAPIVAILILMLLLVVMLITTRKKK